MKPGAFDYVDPATIDDALALLRQRADGTRLLAGGQSLVPLMNFGVVRPAMVIDLNRLTSLAYIEERAGTLAIGALTRQHEVEISPIIRARAPLLAEAMPFVGHSALRRRGTFGGSVAHADPVAEIPTVLVALGATVIARRRGGSRALPADRFFVSQLTTMLEPDELVAEVVLPVSPPGAGAAFIEISRRRGDLALVSAAAELTVSAGGICERASLALGGVGAIPVSAAEEVQLLIGETPGQRLFEEIGRRAAARIDPESDLHASAEYRKEVSAILVCRALAAAAARSNGKSPRQLEHLP